MIDDLRRRIERKEIRLMIGGGVSMATCHQALSWKDTLLHGYDFMLAKGLKGEGWISEEKEDISRADSGQLVRSAEKLVEILTREESSHLWGEWLENCFGVLEPDNPSLIQAILDLNLPIFTTNFDTLIEKVANKTRPPLSPLCLDEPSIFDFIKQSRPKYVVHLHGWWDRPESIIFDVGQYERRRKEELADVAQKLMTVTGLLYIGCGATLDDPNLGTLLAWHARWSKGLDSAFFRLAHDNEDLGSASLSKTASLSVIRYGSSYEDLLPFIRSLKPKRGGGGGGEFRAPNSLRNYLTHVVKEWGELDIPVPREANRSHKELLEYLYIERSFTLEEVGRKPEEANAAGEPGIARRVLDSPPRESEQSQQGLTNISLSEEELLTRPAPQLVVAVAGMGKTALSRRIAWLYARRCLQSSENQAESHGDKSALYPWIPVLLPGALIREEHASGHIGDLIRAALGAPGFDQGMVDTLCDVARQSRGSGLIFIVDGLDEIWPRELRQKVVQALLSIVKNDERNRILVTSRREGLERQLSELSSRFDRSVLCPLSNEQVKQFLMSYIGGPNDPAIARRYERIKSAMEDTRVNEIARIPLGLAMLAQRSTYDDKGGERLTKLLRWMITELIERRTVRGKQGLQACDVIPLMQHVALESLVEDEGEIFSRSRLERLLAGAPGFMLAADGRSARGLLDDIVDQTNLLVKRGTIDRGFDEDTFGFLFKQFREFLAGGGLVWQPLDQADASARMRILAQVEGTALVELEISDSTRTVTETVLDHRWQEPLALAIAQMLEGDAEYLIRNLITPTEDVKKDRARTVLAAKALGEMSDPARSTISLVAHACTRSFISFDDGHGTELSQAVLALSKGRTGELVRENLVELASDTDWQICRAACVWLLDQLRILSPIEDDQLQDMVTESESHDDHLAIEATLRILQLGFQKDNITFAECLEPAPAKKLCLHLLGLSTTSRPNAPLAAWALSWIIRAIEHKESTYNAGRTLLAGVAEAIVSPNLHPMSRAYLALVLSKLIMLKHPKSDYVYEWAVVADTPHSRHKVMPPLAKGPEWLRETVHFLEKRLIGLSSKTTEAHLIALSIGRFGVTTDLIAKVLTDYLLRRQPWEDKEVITYIGLTRTVVAEDCLLRIFSESDSSNEVPHAYLALLANGSRNSWEKLNQTIIQGEGLDQDYAKTLKIFMELPHGKSPLELELARKNGKGSSP